MAEVSKEYVIYLERTLRNWYFLNRQGNIESLEANRLQKEINESNVSGISYDKEPGTHNNTDDPYIVKLVHEQRTHELNAQHLRKVASDLCVGEHLIERLNKLTKSEKYMIEEIYKRNVSITDFANREKVTRQAISSRLENALIKMLEEN